MNRTLTALFSALEALLVVAIGVAIPLVPLTILWAFQYGLQIDWIVFWRTAADLWLLGSGVDIQMTLNPALAAGLGFAGAATPFIITIAPLGFALLTALLGVRAGRRIDEIPHRMFGLIVSTMAFALFSLAVTLSTLFAAARPSIWQGTLLPTLVFVVGLSIGAASGMTHSTDRRTNPFRALAARLRPQQIAVVVASLRAGVAAATVVVAASAVLVAVLFLGNYAAIISLYEKVHAGVLGGIALTVGQIAVLPNLVIWASSWLVGPGFAIGTGSSISPLGTTLGPIPAIPIFGALPTAGTFEWGFVGLLVPVLAGFTVALVVRPRLMRELGASATLPSLVLAGLLSGVVGGIVLALLAWASAGSAGPGRLIDVGPSPWLVGLYAALEIGVAASIGLLAGRPNRAR